ncbi:hypothetical protein D3C84_1143470 [compost metagenome]
MKEFFYSNKLNGGIIMYEMNFHWEKEGKSGQFSVTASGMDACIKIAEEIIQEDNAELVDWYAI